MQITIILGSVNIACFFGINCLSSVLTYHFNSK